VDTLRFGPVGVRSAQRQLLVAGSPVVVGARAFDLLVALIEHRDRAVSKGELLEAVWPGLVVEENNLQVQVSSLRKILGQQAIATIPGRGYRFTLAPNPAEEPRASPMEMRHNLPAQLTSFIGQDEVLHEYADLLQTTRLLTLTGIGGCGKTRLALELAGRALPSFPDGVWFVDLASVADAERLPFSVADALQVRSQIDTPIVETLCLRLNPRRALLVLDNCEQLTNACADLARRLLDTAPQLRILATSREGLNVPGERIAAVRSLRSPPVGMDTNLDVVQSFEAVHLFVERARSVDRAFCVDAATAGAVAEICRRLDGIPLAIELAAARVKVLSVQEICSRLRERFRLLTSGTSATLPRQQTLLAVIRWSYEHLSAEEQRLLRLLSVFSEGWTLAAVMTVIDDAPDEYVVLDALTRLVDRSLVIIERFPDGTSRYAMLESVRQYAQEQLDGSGEGIDARNRHLDYYLSFVKQPEPLHSGRQHALWVARLRRELENLLQALAWCGQVDNGARKEQSFVIALQSFWFHSGLLQLGYEVTRAAAKRDSVCATDRADALMAAASLAFNIDRLSDGSAHLEEAMSIARKLSDDGRVARITRQLAYAAAEIGDSESAWRLMTDMLTQARAEGDENFLLRALNSTAELHRGDGNAEAALPLYQEALALARKQPDILHIAVVSDNLARALISCGKAAEARDLARDVFVISNEARSRWIGLCAFDIATALAAVEGDWTFAARMRGAAEERVKSMKHSRDRADGAFLAQWTARIRESLSDVEYQEAFDIGHSLPDDAASAEALAWLEASDVLRERVGTEQPSSR
jgi:predicted ATPase